MKCFRLVQYDLKQGLIRNRLYWLVPLCTVIVCNQCRLLLSSWEQSGTWAVYLAYCFRGMPRITRQTLSGGFQIPVLWMLMLVLPLLITLNFPFRDMKTIGSQMLLRSERRVAWWLSKCVWNLCSTAVYFALIFITSAVFCVCLRVPLSLDTPMGAMMALFSETDITTAAEEMSNGQVIFVVMVVPFLAAAAMDMAQMLLSLLLRPVYGFLFSVALLAGASYVTSPFLIGNFANLSRCGVFIDNGLNSLGGFLICIGVLVFSVGIGGVLFHKRDILPDYKEL